MTVCHWYSNTGVALIRIFFFSIFVLDNYEKILEEYTPPSLPLQHDVPVKFRLLFLPFCVFAILHSWYHVWNWTEGSSYPLFIFPRKQQYILVNCIGSYVIILDTVHASLSLNNWIFLAKKNIESQYIAYADDELIILIVLLTMFLIKILHWMIGENKNDLTSFRILFYINENKAKSMNTAKKVNIYQRVTDGLNLEIVTHLNYIQ